MLDEIIVGIIFTLPEKLISRIFNDGKYIFTKFTTHPPSDKSIKIRSGNKLFFYKSRADKTEVSEAIIEKIEFLLPEEALKKYKENIITPPEEMPEYIRGRDTKKMLVLELSNIIKYPHLVIMRTPVTMAGQYVTEDNQKNIFGIDIK